MNLPRFPKLPRILAVHYGGLAAILMASTLMASTNPVYADSLKNEAIDHQQKQAQEGIDAAEKAKPMDENRPAVTTKKTLKQPATDGKEALIESQELDAAQSIKDAEAAKPVVENRPAATTKHKKHSVQSHKAEMKRHQQKQTNQSIDDATAAKPDAEGRPAVTTKKTLHPETAAGKDLIESQKSTN
jgi:hypothetical protein